MTNIEFQAKQAKLGLTNEQTSKLLRVSLRTVEKWRQGSRAVPGPVAVVFALLCRYRGAVKYLAGRDT